MTTELSNFATRLRKLIAESNPQVWSERFGALALELLSLQFAANFAYRKICEARGATPQTVTDWRQIPAVPTAAFKEFELTCLAPAQRTHVFNSSGTTGQHRSRHFHCAESLSTYEASLWPWFETNGLCTRSSESVDWQLITLTPSPQEAPHSSLVHMFDTVRQKLGASSFGFGATVGNNGVWELKLEPIVSRLRAAEASGRPALILGTAFSFVHLLDHFTDAGLRFKLPPGSRVMETGGYKGRSREIPKPELHAQISRQLGVTPHLIICEYGMSELSSQAYDDPTVQSRILHFPPWARVQIISPETGAEVADGEAGLLRVFDLANVFSVQAVQTEDLGLRRGDGFELTGRAAHAEPRGCSLMAV